MSLQFSIIVACNAEGGIGRNNAIPWKIKADLKYFSDVTRSTPTPTPTSSMITNKHKNIVIMGRKTWESLGKKPLPGRINMVISSQLQEGRTGTGSASGSRNGNGSVFFSTSLMRALQTIKLVWDDNIHQEVFVIGGEQLYKAAITMPECTKVYITQVHSRIADKAYMQQCDTFFPKDIMAQLFHETEESKQNKWLYENEWMYRFAVFERNA